LARHAVFAGDHARAHHHYDLARKYEKEHIDHLSSQERHSDIPSFRNITGKISSFLESRMDSLRAHGPSQSKAVARLEPSPKEEKQGGLVSTVKRILKRSEAALEKSDTPLTMRQNLAPKAKTSQVKPKDYGRKAGYDYRPFHELSSEQQNQARTNFSGSGHDQFHYPIDPRTKEVPAGVSRFKSPIQAPAPTSRQGDIQPRPNAAPPIAPPAPSMSINHQPGAAGRINKPGHEDHGLFARVKGPNPNVPGKVGVIIRRSRTSPEETTYVAPHELIPSKELRRSEAKEPSNVVLMKSKSTIKRFKRKKR
jgi:hypothetical protein